MEESQNNSAAPVSSEVNSNVPIPNSSDSSVKNPRMAGFGDRFVAILIDSLILFAVTAPLQFIFGISQQVSLSMNSGNFFNAAVGASSISGLVIQFLYFGWFYVNKGQSLGKMAMKIKVVRASDHKYLTWGEVALRDILGKMVSGAVFFLGYLWYFMSEKRQTWHDMIASTYVVKTDDAGNLLMDGPAVYPKEPVKTFGCCAIMGIVLGGLIAMGIFLLISVGTAITEEMTRPGSDIVPGQDMQYDFDADVDVQNDFRMELNGEEVQFEELDDEAPTTSF